ncbi:MAG TPA: hypothetical protein VK452_07230 [Dissulfurispiraceae bacterium]|nr:hypothetical protein [Dissulfurispiraceae bacterium]
MMPFDPGHEYLDVQRQLYGPQKLPPSNSLSAPNAPIDPAPMNGFPYSAIYKTQTDKVDEREAMRIMDAFSRINYRFFLS